MIVKRELLQFSPRVGPKSSITITRINLFSIRQIALNFAFGSLHNLLNYLMSSIPISNLVIHDWQFQYPFLLINLRIEKHSIF